MNISKEFIKKILIFYQEDFQKCSIFLQECLKLSKNGIKNVENNMLDAIFLFNYDIQKASEFVNSFQKLQELGFSGKNLFFLYDNIL